METSQQTLAIKTPLGRAMVGMEFICFQAKIGQK